VYYNTVKLIRHNCNKSGPLATINNFGAEYRHRAEDLRLPTTQLLLKKIADSSK